MKKILLVYYKANQSVGIALRKLWCSCKSANRLWKDLNLSSVLFGKAFRLQPDCERVGDFAAQQHRPSQWIWIHWAWPFCRPFERLNRTFTWNQTFTWNFPLLSANISPQLDDLLCQRQNNVSNLNSSADVARRLSRTVYSEVNAVECAAFRDHS